MRRPLRWWAPSTRWRVVTVREEADQIPDIIPANGIVIAGLSPTKPKWIAFDCPCGAERVMINADPTRRPYWRCVSKFWTGASITPSIDTRHDGKRCHYFIRHGAVLWARNSETGARRERR